MPVSAMLHVVKFFFNAFNAFHLCKTFIRSIASLHCTSSKNEQFPTFDKVCHNHVHADYFCTRGGLCEGEYLKWYSISEKAQSQMISLCNAQPIYFSRFSPFYRDTLFVAFSNCATSVFAGFVIFSFLGHMAKNLKTTVDKVADKGKIKSILYETFKNESSLY